jgi:hypothetical protein
MGTSCTIMGGDLDLMIQKKEAELQPFLSRMEALRLQFVDDTAAFAAKWYEIAAKEYVTKYSEIFLKLTKEKLADMKAQVNALSKNAGKTVTNILSTPDLWWHQAPKLHDSFTQYEKLGNAQIGYKFPEKIDKPVRVALGQLGVVLERFGFNVTTNRALKAAYPEFWFTPRWGTGETRPYYPHTLIWSDEMQDTLQKYNTLFKQAIVMYNQIQKLKDEKEQQQAGDLWDST